jgi:hypothetical protein
MPQPFPFILQFCFKYEMIRMEMKTYQNQPLEAIFKESIEY